MASKTVSKGKPFPVRGVALFIALVAVSGIALKLSNRVDNPFEQISYASTWMQEGDSLNLSTGSSELSALPSLSDLSASGTDSSALDTSSSLPSLSSLSESTAGSAELSDFTLPSLSSDVSGAVDTSS
ncbi:MAG: hypothetical protein U0670_18000, partial [Anaerolineae bacterium]